MTEEEATQLFKRLGDLLEDHDLSWILVRVNETIRLGKLKTEKLTVEEESPDELNIVAPQGRKRSSQKFTISQDFSEKEKLSLLIDAVARVTVDALRVEGEAVRLIAKAAGKEEPVPASEIRFEFRDDNAIEPTRVSDVASRRRVEALGRQLEPLLNELRAEIDAD